MFPPAAAAAASSRATGSGVSVLWVGAGVGEGVVGVGLALGVLDGVSCIVAAWDPAQLQSTGTATTISAATNRNLTRRRVAGRSAALLRAAHQVIVDDSGRLEQRVHDGGADEGEAASLEVLAHAIGQVGRGGEVREGSQVVDHWRSVDPVPEIGRERSELALDLDEGPGVGAGAVDLQPVADDA